MTVLSAGYQPWIICTVNQQRRRFCTDRYLCGFEFEFDGMMTQVDRLTGDKLTIGMPIRIQVVAADVSSGRIDFMPASEVGKIIKENK